ncbi:hypothetical protein ROHU_006525 [Labeo rohita]|uniref:Uncharacterized protein n=1 Tax=Labeo rohita TaxID=84645 RepID=A0A498MNS4_LABRO|nr:hypothetical protein ROHU_006525 [Labeo rohita]
MGALDVYNHYKFHHFFSICFGLGFGLLLYRPFYSIVVPSVLGVFFTLGFECVGASFGLPAHTRKCKGRPYHWKDVVWGYCMAFFVTFLHLKSYHGRTET